MRSLALALVALLTLAAPAAARCPKTRSGSPVRAELATAGYVTAVRVCDRRTGRRRTLARARAQRPGSLAETGTRIGDVDYAGRRVVWSIRREQRHRTTITMHEAIVRRQRVQTVTRRVLYSGKRFSREPWGYVAVSNRGDLAWEGPHVVLRPAGQRARVVGDDGILLAFEDERTLRWNANDGLAYHDVRAPHMRDGCPSRQRFAPLAQSDQVLVTLARYGDAETNDDERTVARVCLRGAGGDHVVDQASTNANGEGTTLGVAGVDGPWAVLTNIESSRVGSAMTLRAVHAGTGATARRADVSGYASDIHRPDRDTSAVVTDAGIPAWISTFHDQASLFVVAPNGQFSLLGTGPAGTITDLRSDGPRIAWTQAGEPHTVLPA